MGEAKCRGTFEQRKAEGIAKREKQEEEKELAREQFLASLSPEQREKLKKNQHLLTMMMGLAV